MIRSVLLTGLLAALLTAAPDAEARRATPTPTEAPAPTYTPGVTPTPGPSRAPKMYTRLVSLVGGHSVSVACFVLEYVWEESDHTIAPPMSCASVSN